MTKDRGSYLGAYVFVYIRFCSKLFEIFYLWTTPLQLKKLKNGRAKGRLKSSHPTLICNLHTSKDNSELNDIAPTLFLGKYGSNINKKKGKNKCQREVVNLMKAFSTSFNIVALFYEQMTHKEASYWPQSNHKLSHWIVSVTTQKVSKIQAAPNRKWFRALPII